LCEEWCAFASAGLRCLEVPAMQQRPKTWVASLAAEDWRCNPCLALLCLVESQTQSRVTRSNRSDHLALTRSL